MFFYWLLIIRPYMTHMRSINEPIGETIMEYPYERWKKMTYLANLLTQSKRSEPINTDNLRSVYDWILGNPVNAIRRNSRRRAFHLVSGNEDGAYPKDLLDAVIQTSRNGAVANRGIRESALEKNIQTFSSAIGLTALEREILGFGVRIRMDINFKSIIEVFNSNPLSLLATALKRKRHEIEHLALPGKNLQTLGILSFGSNGGHYLSDLSDFISLDHAMDMALRPPVKNIEKMRAMILKKADKGILKWEDYDHIDDYRNLALKVVEGALKNQTKGVNVLLYGPPGTGKTEFSKVVATRLKMALYSISSQDDNGCVVDSRERLASLAISHRLMKGYNNAIVLFDEMEDIARTYVVHDGYSMRSQGHSKGYLNTVLETSPVPVIWTCNNTHEFDPALLRRMTITIELKVPPRKVRAKILKRTLKKSLVPLSDEAIERFANEFEVAPALAENAVIAASLAGGGEEEMRLALRGLDKLVNNRSYRKVEAHQKNWFMPGLVHSNPPLIDLSGKILSKNVKRNFSLLLYGPPGTGKSAYVRHLAESMGMEVLHRRASDLLSMWVGGSEKNIAQAFEKAMDDEAFLIFDEADSLLQSRSGAHRSWEVTQVNEMLTWMESHPLPFACTTNLLTAIDPAAMRRFTFKACFNYLTAAQSVTAFEYFFGVKPPVALSSMTMLAPGDFSVVKKKADILGCINDADALLEMLKAECEIKPDKGKRVGF